MGGCTALAAIGWLPGGYRLSSLLVFLGLLVAAAAYWWAARVVLGIVGARELPVGEAPALHATVARLAAVAGVPKPRLYLLTDGHPRALSAGPGPRGAAVAPSPGALAAPPPPGLGGGVPDARAHSPQPDAIV